MTGMTENKKSNLFLLFAIVFVALAIVGGIRGYSPVPFWDMWDGYLGFYVKVLSGDTSAWWAQHNEHRIILARCFFWLDFVLFAGQGWFLIVVNYLLLGIVCALYWTIWNESKQDKHNWIGFFLIAWLFWWIQKDNLEWGFQSQFILAQFLPLAAFYCLHRSVYASKDTNKWFVFAIVLGCLSIGSMANGVLALPIMTLYALITRMGRLRIGSLGGLSVLAIWLYFYGYVAPQGHGSLGQAIRENPIGLLHYVFVYVGSAFSFGDSRIGVWTAAVAGMFLVASSVIFTLKILINPRQETLQLALLAFILYVGGTALGTAGGRLIFGVDQALASRYMTPSLMAWAALLLLYLPKLEAVGQSVRGKVWVPFLLLTLLMLPYQLKALKSKQSVLFEREIAALALELGVEDQSQISNIFPNASWAVSIAEEPVARNLSVFGLFPYKDAREMIEQNSTKGSRPDYKCLGSIDEVQTIEGDAKLVRVRGWIFDPHSRQAPKAAQLIDKNGIVQGLIMTGQARPDVANAIDSIAINSGFKGYVSASAQGQTVNLVDPQGSCQISASIPTVFFKTSKAANGESVSVSINQLQGHNIWTGTDYNRSSISDLTILGSFIRSDADKGSIILKLNRGDKLLYRSGPAGGRQLAQVIGHPELKINLPVATEWILLEFSSDILPKVFDIELTDNGESWGEWSAIALRSRGD